jgi:hypothetical protein
LTPGRFKNHWLHLPLFLRYFLPVMIGNRSFVDGSTPDPCIFTALQHAVGDTIAIDVSGGPNGDPDVLAGKVEVMYKTSQTCSRRLSAPRRNNIRTQHSCGHRSMTAVRSIF